LARGAYQIPYLAGYRNMQILDEGIPGWVDKGYPTAAKRPAGRP
jgi:3-mercaptopyruvate sulfurtransferase SseA